MNLAMVCRADNSGLGTMSWEYARHLKPKKVLIIDAERGVMFPERYKDFETKTVKNKLTPDVFEWIFDDIDILLSIETFYDYSLIKEARRRNVKTALITMFEMQRDPIPLHADLYICPSKLDIEYFPDNKVFIPPPIATDRLLWKLRKKANTFIHSASHGGMSGRKGTQLFLDAIPLVKNQNVKFVIYCWQNDYKVSDDPRVELKVVNFKNYWQLWREGDVLVYPQGCNGICLPIIEAMAAGLAVITTDIYPFNEYMPKELLFKPYESFKIRMAPGLMEVTDYRINPGSIAEKIDKIAGKSISRFSEYGKSWAEKNSWKVLLSKYQHALKQLYRNN